jgi:hypothetical protein
MIAAAATAIYSSPAALTPYADARAAVAATLLRQDGGAA